MNVEDLTTLSLSELGGLENNGSNTELQNRKKLKMVKQASAGKVDVLPSNAVSIDDIDVDEIPEDQDVILSPEKKQVLLIGKPIEKFSSSSDEKEDNNDFLQKVTKNVFEEKSEEEYMRKYTFFFDEYTKERNFTSSLGLMFRYAVFLFGFYTFYKTYTEYRDVMYTQGLYQNQRMEQLQRNLNANRKYAFEHLRRMVFPELEEKGDDSEELKRMVFERLD